MDVVLMRACLCLSRHRCFPALDPTPPPPCVRELPPLGPAGPSSLPVSVTLPSVSSECTEGHACVSHQNCGRVGSQGTASTGWSPQRAAMQNSYTRWDVGLAHLGAEAGGNGLRAHRPERWLRGSHLQFLLSASVFLLKSCRPLSQGSGGLSARHFFTLFFTPTHPAPPLVGPGLGSPR